MTTMNIDPKLAKSFNFTNDDLKYNEQGRLSPEQQDRLQKQSARSTGFGFASLILMVVLLTIPFWGEYVGLGDNLNDIDQSYIIILIISTITLVPVAFLMLRHSRQQQSIIHNDDSILVKEYIDRVIVTHRGADDPPILQLPDAEFQVTTSQANQITNNEVYRIHYAPAFSAVVAIAPYPSNKDTGKIIREALQKRYQIPANVPARAAQLWHFNGDDLIANRRGEFGEFQLQPNRLFNTHKINQQTIEVVEGKIKLHKGEQNILITKIPTIELEIGGVMVKTFSRFAHLLEESFLPDEYYRLYYVYDPQTRSNRPLSIEAIN